MSPDEARQRIEWAIGQFGGHAAPMLEQVMAEVRSSMGTEAANDLIDEFDLELRYNIPPTEIEGSGD